MILAITPNPSIDISYKLDHFEPAAINKIQDRVKTPGGKGINVAKVLKLIGANPICSGFLGGKAGEYIEEELEIRGIKSDFIKINGESRSCYAIRNGLDGQITELREKGPEISEAEEEAFFDNLEKIYPAISIITCSGSLPLGLGQTFYDKLLEKTKDKKFILDTSGEYLRKIVLENPIKPFAIKPNMDELVDIFGQESISKKPVELLKDYRLKDIPLVILSMGSRGAICKYEDRFFTCTVPSIKAINPVGSGDSSLAGLAYGLDKGLDIEEILCLSMACGVLNAMEREIGHIDVRILEDIKRQIEIKELS